MSEVPFSNFTTCNDLMQFWTALDFRDAVLIDSYSGSTVPVPQTAVGRVADDPHSCIYAYNRTLYQDDCTSVYPCGLCMVPFQTMFVLRGFCRAATAARTGHFDHVFYHRGFRNGRPLFK